MDEFQVLMKNGYLIKIHPTTHWTWLRSMNTIGPVVVTWSLTHVESRGDSQGAEWCEVQLMSNVEERVEETSDVKSNSCQMSRRESRRWVLIDYVI